MKVRPLHVLFVLLGMALCLVPFRARIRSGIIGVIENRRDRKDIAERIAEYGDAVHSRLADRFREIQVSYPPKKMLLIGLKQERVLEVWVANGDAVFQHLKTYPILAASGRLGPKLAEGDSQVPEGIYKIESLNPNSSYHLSLRVNYPNPFDSEHGKLDGRTDLGSDIMIHGKTVSIGCLAMGDPASEDLFVMAAETGIENIDLILSPVDFRVRDLPTKMSDAPTWKPGLYAEIREALRKFPQHPIPISPNPPD